MEVCHTCDKPPCQNPAHLFLGTHQQNMDDRDRKGRVAKGERSGARKSGTASWERAKGDRNGTHTHPEKVTRGENHPSAKMTTEQVAEIRRRYAVEKRFGTKARLAREFGISDTNLHAILTGKTWKHLLAEKGG